MSTHSDDEKAALKQTQQVDVGAEEGEEVGRVEGKTAGDRDTDSRSRDEGSDEHRRPDGGGGGTDAVAEDLGGGRDRDGSSNATGLPVPSYTKPLPAVSKHQVPSDAAGKGSSATVDQDEAAREELLLRWRGEWEAELAEKKRVAEEEQKHAMAERQKAFAAREREHYVRMEKMKVEASAAEEQHRRATVKRVEQDLGKLRLGEDVSPLKLFEGGAAMHARPALSSDSESDQDGLFPSRRATRSYAKTHNVPLEELPKLSRRRAPTRQRLETERRPLGGQPTLAMTHFSAYSDPSATVEEKNEVLKLVAAEGGSGQSKKKAQADALRDQRLGAMEREVLRLAAQRDRALTGQAEASAAYEEARRLGNQHWQREAKADAIRAEERALTLQLEVSRQQLEIEKLRMTLSTAREERDNRSRHYPARMKGIVTGFHELTSVNGGGYWATDVLMYLKEVVAKCAAHGYDRPTDTAHMFVSGLSGESLEWYLEFRRAHLDYALHFEVLSLAFLDKFGGGETAMREEFVHIVKQPGESTERLLRRILTLGEALGYSCRAPEVAAQFWAALPKGQQLKCVEHGLGQSRDVYAMLRLLSPIDKYAEEQKRNATRRGGHRAAAASTSRQTGAGAGTAVNYVGAGSGFFFFFFFF